MRLLILESNLLWSTRLSNAAKSLGFKPTVSRIPIEGKFDVAIVNLGEPNVNWPDRVQTLRARGMKVVGHAGHKEKELLELGRAAGCDRLATNSEMANRLDRVLENLVERRVRTAITGGVAEGKSTVLMYLKEAGHMTASADEFARGVFSSPEVQKWLESELSEPPSRNAVRARMAVDHQFRRKLNEVTHPLIVKAILESPSNFIEVPLLIETCTYVAFDKIWVVTCGEAEQRIRLASRLKSEAAADELMRTQLPTRAKIPFADLIVRTNQGEETVRRYVIEALARI